MSAPLARRQLPHIALVAATMGHLAREWRNFLTMHAKSQLWSLGLSKLSGSIFAATTASLSVSL